MSATPAPTSIIYVRVSTADQDLDHQREALWEYAIEDLGIAAGNLSVLEDRSTGTMSTAAATVVSSSARRA